MFDFGTMRIGHFHKCYPSRVSVLLVLRSWSQCRRSMLLPVLVCVAMLSGCGCQGCLLVGRLKVGSGVDHLDEGDVLGSGQVVLPSQL